MNTGPIFLIDTDHDDRIIVKELFAELDLPNPIFYFSRAEQLIDQIQQETVHPFIILCEVDLPGMDGIALRERVLQIEDGHYDAVPFIFWSNQTSPAQVLRAYQLSSHGFFKKPNTFAEMKKSLLRIMDYWSDSLLPPDDQH